MDARQEGQQFLSAQQAELIIHLLFERHDLTHHRGG